MVLWFHLNWSNSHARLYDFTFLIPVNLVPFEKSIFLAAYPVDKLELRSGGFPYWCDEQTFTSPTAKPSFLTRVLLVYFNVF